MVRDSARYAPRAFCALFFVLLPLRASAQSFYVDCGSDPPSPAFGAAYGVPGVWNSIAEYGSHPLVDSGGATTPATAFFLQNKCGLAGCDAPALVGDPAALLEDWFFVDCFSFQIIDLDGLEGGQYQLFLYGYHACEPDGAHVTADVQVGGELVLSVESGGSPFTGDWADFPLGKGSFTYTAGEALTFRVGATTIGSGLAGFQLVHLGPEPTPYCFGDLGECPCGNGDAMHGCPSSFDSAGASLIGTGSAQLGNDSFQLTAQGTSSTVVTFIQSNVLLGSGFGVPFGDGLRCAGENLVRLASKQAVGGVATYPEAGEESISVRGAIPPGGGFRGYQVWYRDPNPGYCTPDTFNLTNAVAVEWY